MIRVLSGEPRELPHGEVRAELREAAFRGADRRRALCTASRGPGGAQGASESPTHRTERLALEHGAGALLRPTGQRARTISALIYPVILMLLAVVLVGGIVFTVVPQFAEFFSQMGHGAELP